ncbi:hypothetical protein B0H19DRAFT_957090, partial [Mycena capillaripes]
VNSPAVPLKEVSLETFKNVISVNLVRPSFCAREAVKVLRAKSRSSDEHHPTGYKFSPKSIGRIIDNGSLSAHTPRPMSSPYTASKHGMTGLSKCIALDGRAFNIACTQIDVGNAATALTARMEKGVPQPNGLTVPESTFDVAHVAVHIASLPVDVAAPHSRSCPCTNLFVCF